MKVRDYYRKGSNNQNNTNKNICALAVANELGVSNSVHYLHNISDLVRAVRNKYVVRSRMSKVKGMSVGKARNIIRKLGDDSTIGFIARVKGHVILLNSDGSTKIDTDPIKRDARKITHFYIVY